MIGVQSSPDRNLLIAQNAGDGVQPPWPVINKHAQLFRHRQRLPVQNAGRKSTTCLALSPDTGKPPGSCNSTTGLTKIAERNNSLDPFAQIV